MFAIITILAAVVTAQEGVIGKHLKPKDGDTCYKSTYGRGAGRGLHTCPPGHEKDGLLCYPKCKSGYRGVGPVCWEDCPSTHKDIGLTCKRGGYITKSTGKCPWYDVCGLFNDCTKCPAGTRNDGCTCWHRFDFVKKDTYGRGAGRPMWCGDDEDQEGLLCYPKCKKGYIGVGPVCWQKCSHTESTKEDGGAICCKSKTKCAAKNAKLVAKGLKTGISLVAAVKSGGLGALKFVGSAISLGAELTFSPCDTSGRRRADEDTVRRLRSEDFEEQMMTPAGGLEMKL